MGQCNYCSMQGIKRNAKQQKKKVVTRYSSFMGGINVFTVPQGVEIPKKIVEASDELPNGDKFHEEYFTSWFMELPDHCCC